MEKLYIAYGNNMDTDRMARRCPEAEFLGTSELSGYRLLFKGSQTGFYATIERASGFIVPVVLWSLTRSDEQRLDYYEGFPNFYTKEMLPMPLYGKVIEGMAYVMPKDRPFGIPASSYISLMSGAYKKFGFDMAILKRALKDTEEYAKL